MANANTKACKLIKNPDDEKFWEAECNFQGCPTIAITKGGRIFVGWYKGGWCEPSMQNYNVLVYSDDFGKSFSKPVLIIPSCKAELIHALDIQLWLSPEGKLYVFWVQNNVEIAGKGKRGYCVDGYIFEDRTHSEWVTVCDDPDADVLEFSSPFCLDKGFLRCKPLVSQSGRWINFNYSQDGERYEYSVSDDNGKSYTHKFGAKKIATPFDETMAYQKKDKSIRMLARSYIGELAESTSFDDGETWSEATLSGIESPNTRFFVSRTPGGKVILINNCDRYIRKNMSVYLSDDDGATWQYRKCIDGRSDVSYPDADFYGGRIYTVYDRGRSTDKEILFLSFTEEDIMNPYAELKPTVISKI